MVSYCNDCLILKRPVNLKPAVKQSVGWWRTLSRKKASLRTWELMLWRDHLFRQNGILEWHKIYFK